MSQHPVVTTACGPVEGRWRNTSSAAFLGIPFAQPPVGELRFAAPVRRAAWDGVFVADRNGATPQRRQIADLTAIPEPSIEGTDTLCLNVFTPRPSDAEAKLPVYVWIHGGGFTAGSPASPWYDGTAFNRDGVVTVSLSYRLGFDGFGWIEDAPHNRGVLDWLLGLEWVQENIASFGGDPDNVTIGGQSAGGGAVLTLLGMPRAQGLFRRVISHSGAPADIGLAAAEAYGRELAAMHDVEPTRAGFAVLDEAMILDSQDALGGELDGDKMKMVRAVVTGEGSMLKLGPVIDGDLIPHSVAEAISRGIGSDKALLLGTVANEFNAITAQAPLLLKMIPRKALLKKAGVPGEVVKEYIGARPGMNSPEILGQLLTDAMFRVPLTRIADDRADTWVFDFRFKSATSHLATHCIDLPFAWDCIDAPHVVEQNTGPNPPQALADDMHGAWVKFIVSGDPGWERYSAPRRAGMVFDVPAGEVVDAYGIERRLRSAVDGVATP